MILMIILMLTYVSNGIYFVFKAKATSNTVMVFQSLYHHFDIRQGYFFAFFVSVCLSVY